MLGAAWISWHLGKSMRQDSIIIDSNTHVSIPNIDEVSNQNATEAFALKEKCQHLLLINNERLGEIHRLKTVLEQTSIIALNSNSKVKVSAFQNGETNKENTLEEDNINITKNERELSPTQKSLSVTEATVREIEVIKEVPVEVIKEVEVIRNVEVIREVPVETIKEVEVIREVERRVEVPIEIFKEIIRTVEVPVEVIKEVEVIKVVEKKVNVPVEIIKEVQVSNIRKEKALNAKLEEANNLLTTLKSQEKDYLSKLSIEKKNSRKLKYDIKKLEADVDYLNTINSTQLKTVEKNKKQISEITEKLIASNSTIQEYEAIIAKLNKEAKSNTTSKKSSLSSKKEKQNKDDLKIIEGVGPAIEKLLNANSINTFKILASTKTKALRKILNEAGNEYARHDPTTWPEQSRLAEKGYIEKLNKLQKKLKGGKK